MEKQILWDSIFSQHPYIEMKNFWMTRINSPVSWWSLWLSINFYMELLRLKLLFLCLNSHTVFMKIPINFIPPTMSMQSPHSFQITPHLHVLYSVRA